MKKLLITSLILTVFAVACGTSTSSASPSARASSSISALASSSPSAAASASAMPSSFGASVSSVGDPCGLLAKSDVEAVVGTMSGQPSATSAPMTGVADRASVCAYRGANGLLTIAVLTKAMTRPDFDSLMRQVPGVQSIAGIGDAAYGTSAGTNGANGASVLVLKGTTYFTLVATSPSNDGSTMLGTLETLASQVAGKL